MDSKRQRSENFTAEDKELLVERVMERKDIIEMKKSDNVTAKAKEQAWQDIANDYNSYTTFPRSAGALKMCWENLKRKCRKFYTAEQSKEVSCNRRRSNPTDPVLDKVRDILILTSGFSNNTCDKVVLFNDGSNSHNMSSGIKEEDMFSFNDRKVIPYEHYNSTLSECSSHKLKRSSSDILHSSEKRMLLQSTNTSPYIQTLGSDTSESDTQDMEETNTVITSRLNNISDSTGGDCLGESSKTSPYVQRLTTETVSNEEKPPVEVPRVNSCRSTIRPRRQNHQINSLADVLTESKIELVKLTKMHAISEERRRNELHNLQVEETRLKIIEEKKRIALYELRAQETELKIEALKTKLEYGIYD